MSYKAPTVMFVCDACGLRKPLDKTKRHWCEACGVFPIEMRCTRDRKPGRGSLADSGEVAGAGSSSFHR
jgi:predicted RNA-binding Zn-ribbon protein involved in translation (DUF1610 family)